MIFLMKKCNMICVLHYTTECDFNFHEVECKKVDLIRCIEGQWRETKLFLGEIHIRLDNRIIWEFNEKIRVREKTFILILQTTNGLLILFLQTTIISFIEVLFVERRMQYHIKYLKENLNYVETIYIDVWYTTNCFSNGHCL